LANLAIALGWALKHSCKGCAHRLFTTLGGSFRRPSAFSSTAPD
jgi:hypothetical protein